MQSEVRAFRAADAGACLAIFDSNTPKFFALAERAEFAAFLAGLPAGESPYLVVEQRGDVVACGGLALNEDLGQARLIWGMVDASLHSQGFGRLLTAARIDLARGQGGIAHIALATSQHTCAFYQRLGFELTLTTPNGFGAGIDRCEMTLHVR